MKGFDSHANADVTDGAVEMLSILSDRTRLRIVALLCGDERSVTIIAATLRVPQPTVSHHLALLRLSGVLVHRRAARQALYKPRRAAGGGRQRRRGPFRCWAGHLSW